MSDEHENKSDPTPPPAPESRTTPTPAPVPVTPPTPADPNPHANLLLRLAEAERKLAEAEAAERQRAEEKRLAEEKKLADKGQYEEIIRQRDVALAEERRKAADVIERTKAAERNRELAIALASGPKLVEGAAEQLMELLSNKFDVVEEGQAWQVRTKDLKSPGQYVAELLATPKYSHFVAAEARGGGGANPGGDQGLPSPLPGETPPKLTAGELTLLAVKQQLEEKKKSDPLGGYSLGRGGRAIVRSN
jgi:hypothetical protein